MTPSEFKAWFDGFSDGIESVPTEKQWKKIQDRVAQINNVSVTWPVYVEHYRPYWRDYPYAVYGTAAHCSNSDSTLASAFSGNMNAAANLMAAPSRVPQYEVGHIGGSFDSHKAMNDLGREDFATC